MKREYLSIPEAAAMLGISRIAVFKKVKKGQMAAIRFGRNWAVPVSEINRVKVPPGKIPGNFAAARPRRAPVSSSSEADKVSENAEMDSMGWD